MSGQLEPSDKVLLHQAKAGDALAFDTLFRRHSVQQAAWAKKNLCRGNQNDADELIQWAFLLTHKNLRHMGDADMSFVEIIQSNAQDLQRIQHHKTSKLLHDFLNRSRADWVKAAAWSNLDIDEIVRRQTEMKRIQSDPRTGMGLSRLFRQADGMSIKAIALADGVTEATVKKTIRLASKALKAFFQPE